MTSLEHALAAILESIENTAANSPGVAVLLRRKEAICAALAAPEQAWHDPRGEAPGRVVQREAASKVVMPLVA
jgi:hypothetical protein